MKAWIRLFRTEINATINIALPIIMGQLGVILMGVVDTKMLGKLGTTAIAATGAASNVFFLITVFGFGAVTVISPRIASCYQKKDFANCHLMLRTSIWMSLLLGGAILILLNLCTYYFEIFGQNEAVTQAARSYLNYANWSIIPTMLYLGMKQFTDGLAATRIGMITTWAGFFINVGANGLLIFGYGNMIPAMGIEGAGLGTLIARCMMALIIALFVFRHAKFAKILKTVYPDGMLTAEIKKMFRMGASTGFAYFFESAAFGVAGLLIGKFFGENQLAAHQIAISVASVSYMIIAGLGAAGAIRVGQNLGANSISKVTKAGISALIIGSIAMGISCILFIAFPKFFVDQFLYYTKAKDWEVLPIALTLMMVGGIFQLSDGIQAVALGLLRGVSDVKIPMYITLFSYWVIGIPVGLLFGIYFEMQALGIWIGLTSGLTFSAFLLTRRFFRIVRTHA